MNFNIKSFNPRFALSTIIRNIAAKCSIVFVLISVIGCGSSKKINKDFLYFQSSLDSMETIQRSVQFIKNNDLLSIQIYTKSINQDQALIFNLPDRQNYLVGPQGNIDLPIIGEMRAAGLTKEQLQVNLKDKLSSYIKEPSVFIRFTDFKINVLGEVKLPGTHTFNKDRVTIIDAISAAGDLTDYGKRNDVMVIREERMQRKYYQVDLRSGTIFQSPVYELQPNDIVYVGAVAKKLKSIESDPDSQKGWQLLFGITSVISTIVTLAITISNNN